MEGEISYGLFVQSTLEKKMVDYNRAAWRNTAQ